MTNSLPDLAYRLKAGVAQVAPEWLKANPGQGSGRVSEGPVGDSIWACYLFFYFVVVPSFAILGLRHGV